MKVDSTPPTVPKHEHRHYKSPLFRDKDVRYPKLVVVSPDMDKNIRTYLITLLVIFKDGHMSQICYDL